MVGRGLDWNASSGALMDRIAEDIRGGALRNSAAIDQVGLARRHGASRAEVRVALAALNREGIVTAVPRRGYVLRAVEPGEAFDLFVLRAAVESAAAAEVAARIDGRLVEVLLAPASDTADHLCQSGLHRLLAQSCGSARLGTLFESAHRAGARLTGAGMVDPDPRTAVLEHQEILHAVLRGDARSARDDMKGHIERLRARALRQWLEHRDPLPR